ncbi:MAG: 1-(5-phosphoribosyl)-5-[(5-phosphoribosylamino)methylideneamino] imidazole-4-carboxamide isomerase [Candidatus Binatus sp.]|uniref:1-(5-phosphoribosyl)-5-[(5- phosphoribosylamino)methylideneamino]imidazole-4- carboxamide isomerase n=1 Tax=Candidatus Binatus sp. TaxID=2811406 RepID=UPI002715A0DF|nr:1-(5-phosphoribosyl)-5-[(5-phosphoribosylamino)methylideneamino] imidazole-4-carboxamide isomerase [Candidatus Binatus sp.]MDO8434220.1 1-(5-phosphoribosyl)-5-[(5-phosphoribosylamino)methylideneamino] imidazole-4-carboxamide isomerase [Candidatus Binatus sp.]
MFEQFTVIPAIDLKGGQVVRLLYGDMNRATVYGSDPAAVAKRFEDQGARLIHVVDLDGAIAGMPRNLDAIAKIRAAVRCAIDVSGGLRMIESVRAAVAAGADYVSIGSAAFLNPELVHRACAEYPARVFGSLDVRDGMLAIKGWVETSALSVDAAARRFLDAGVAAAIVTDISRDGAQAGVDAARMAETARLAALPIIASGGVSALDDVVALRARFDDGVVGAIVGRALYEGNFSLEQAVAAAR